jgi:phage-related tail fiber protein
MATYSKAQVKAAVKAALEQCRPVGSYLLFAGKTLPSGYLLCNGAAVSRTTYAALFAVIGTTYGAGDGSTTFNLPNLDGRVLQGVNDLTKVGTYLESGLPNITGLAGFRGIYANSGVALDGYGAFSLVKVDATANPAVANDGDVTIQRLSFSAAKNNSIYKAGAEVQNPAIQALIAIRY